MLVSWRDTIQEEDSEESYEIDQVSPKVYYQKQEDNVPTILLKKNKSKRKKVKKPKFRNSLLQSPNESGYLASLTVPE